MLPTQLAICTALAGVLAQGPATQTAIRIDDWEVSAQMEQVQRGLDRFIGAWTSARGLGATGGQADADLSSTLDGLRAAGRRMAAAYRPPARSATEETVRFLAQARDIHARLAFPPDAKPLEARWTPLVETFVHLGQAYRIDWRADQATWAPRRVSDQELRLAVTSLRAASDDVVEMLRAMLEKDQVIDKTEKQRAIQQLKAFSLGIRDLLQTFEGYDDMSDVIPRVQKVTAIFKPFVESYPGARPVQPQWQSLNAALETVVQAFGLPRRP